MAAPAWPVGIGLRAPHFREILERRPPLGFVEVHAENFFAEGGAAIAWLERIREAYALSLHGVGLSLGSTDPLDSEHLARLERLVRRFEPALVSEHLCWGAHGGRHANELLPLPYTMESARHLAARIQAVQERLGRPLLVENVAAYVRFPESALAEGEFVAEVVRRAGCALLLDVGNAWVNAANHGFDAGAILQAIDPASVAEIHVAGFVEAPEGLIDTHSTPVCADVWRLLADAAARTGPVPTLVEWDADLPALEVLLGEAARAGEVAGRHGCALAA